MIRACESEGCNTLTLGSYCLACEQRDVGVAPLFPRGRPFLLAMSYLAESAPDEGKGSAPPSSSPAP
jgi:hypothetical protein